MFWRKKRRAPEKAAAPTPETVPRDGWVYKERCCHLVHVFGVEWLDARMLAVCTGISREDAEEDIVASPVSRDGGLHWIDVMRMYFPDDYAEYMEAGSRERVPEGGMYPERALPAAVARAMSNPVPAYYERIMDVGAYFRAHGARVGTA